MRKSTKATAATAITLALAITGLTPAAFASTSPRDGSGDTTVTAQMTPDCSNLSKVAIAYIVSHGLQICGYNQPSVGKVLSVTSGGCGTANFTIHDDGQGYAEVSYGFASSVGPMVHRDLDAFINTSPVGAYYLGEPASTMFSATYEHSIVHHFGFGYIQGDLNGTATTIYDLTCTMLVPSSSTYLLR